MASTETICARLCLLTRFALKQEMPAPLSRATACRMIRLGAIEGLALRSVSGVKEAHYARAQRLLSRSSEIYDGLEHLREQGYDVLLPEDENWPANLCALGLQMPQFLFVRGNAELFSRRAVAVAGSRKIEDETFALAADCGRKIAQEGFTLVCGGAKGVDTAAQQGALNAGGRLILVPALPAQELLRQKYLCDAMEDGRLLLVCDTWPDEPFSAAKALSRNHAIYALGSAALVVASRNGVGGSWRGSTDCLRGGYTPVYTMKSNKEDMAGNLALLEIGAKEFDCSQPLGAQLFGARRDGYASQT